MPFQRVVIVTVFKNFVLGDFKRSRCIYSQILCYVSFRVEASEASGRNGLTQSSLSLK